MLQGRHGILALGAALLLPAAAVLLSPKVRADETAAPVSAERCALRLGIALTGKAPAKDILEAQDPRSRVDAILASPEFVEHFSRFVNAQLNPEPGVTAADDGPYFMTKHVLNNKLPWRDVFAGRWNLKVTGDQVSVEADPAGLGYFRTTAWKVRFAGNENDGVKLVTAYRILRNTVGLELVPNTNGDNVDTSAKGRQAPQCRGCHYDGWYALDKVAAALNERAKRNGEAVTFVPRTDGPQQILGGKSIGSDEELVNALVDSTDFRVRSCRTVFQFLYGRSENVCEGDIFDKCMDALTATGDIRAAVSAVAKDETFCQ
jgi:hypothetical protein